LKSFFDVDVPEDKMVLVSGILEALTYTNQYAYKENIEFSNTYIVNKRAVSSNGYHIVSHDVDCPDTKFLYGTDKVLRTQSAPNHLYNNICFLAFSSI